MEMRPSRERQTSRRRPAQRPPTSRRRKGCTVRATGSTRRTNAREQGTTHTTDGPPAVLHGERAEGAAGDANPPQPATVEERLHPGAATSPARMGMHDGPPPGSRGTKDILASIFNETAPTGGQGRATDEHPHNDESLTTFMASCRDGDPTTGPATTSALRHMAQHREPTSPTRDPASASHQAHLRRNYAGLGPVAAVHATTAGDGHAGRQSLEVASQRTHAQVAPTHEIRKPTAADVVSGLMEWMPPEVARPWREASLDYEQSKVDAQRPSAEADGAAALDLDLWLPRTSDVEQLTIQVRTRLVLMDLHHIRNGTCTMVDVIFNHHEGQHSAIPTLEHPSQWQYVATRLMAHMGAHTPDDLNLLHWRWHHRRALRIREALIRRNIGTGTPRPRGPPIPDRATGHQRQRSPT